ncbi:MAG: C13 family peptidase [Casimicrobiaceae bacterium]
MKSPVMRSAIIDLGRNLAAGLRLALFLPVTRGGFRVSPGQLVLIAIVSAAIDVDTDWVRAAQDAHFSIYGLHGEMYSLGLLVLSSAIIAALRRDAWLALALPVIVLAAFPVIQIVAVLPDLPQTDPAITEATRRWFDYALDAWTALLCMRAVHACLEPRETTAGAHRRLWSLAGGLLIVLPIWFAPLAGPLDPWWSNLPPAGARQDAMSPASEPALAAQQFLLDQALDGLDDEQPGVTDLYFVGFAPDSRRIGFVADVESATHVMNEHWNTHGRSVVLVNSPSTIAQRPFATVTNLRETLEEIGGIIDPDEDIVMIYLTGDAGVDGTLAAINPPLELVPLSPSGLRSLLDSAGIRWRVVVVSACHAGAWVNALKDDETAVIASSAADVHGAGCAGSIRPGAFGTAFFGDGMSHSDSLAKAFSIAHAALAREGAATPVLWIGPAIAERLKAFREGKGGRVVADR